MIRTLGTVLFFLSVLGTAAALLGVAASLAMKKGKAARLVALAVPAWWGVYFALLLAVSWTSRDTVLPPNGEIFFSTGLDRDLALSVTHVERAHAIGTPPDTTKAEGLFYIVFARVRSDAAKNPMRLENPVIELVDEKGNRYQRSPAAEFALDGVEERSVSLETPVAVGEHFDKTLAFDVPKDAGPLFLAASHGGPEMRFIIGEENSLLHARTLLSLPTR